MVFRIDVKSKSTGEVKSTILKVSEGQNVDLAIEECIDGFVKEMGALVLESPESRGLIMQIVYINGVKATYADLATLFERVRKGLDCIIEIHTTKKNNIAVVTA